MNGTKLFIDTNIVVYLLNGDDTLSSFLQGRTVYVSFITQLELLGYNGLTVQEERDIEEFLSHCIIVDINPGIKREVIRIRKNYKVKLPDSIIMASTLYLDLPVLTADGDFNRVEDLEVIHYENG